MHQFQLNLTGERIPESWSSWRVSKHGALSPLPMAEITSVQGGGRGGRGRQKERRIRDATKLWDKVRLQVHCRVRDAAEFDNHKTVVTFCP